AGRIVQDIVAADGGNACTVVGTPLRASAGGAALANGTAAHALDYDDMCFVSLAHPSAPLVAAIFAAGELAGAAGSSLLDAYVVGFEIEARLGRTMNPRHYERGWHCTSTLGSVGAAAGVGRVLGLDAARASHALAIAMSSASGLKENFGTMTKPLHAGLAAEAGVRAARLAERGLTASAAALDGPQGFLRAMNGDGKDVAAALADLGSRWEILDTGITIKLYPSCAGTHPALDAILDLRSREGLTPDAIERIDVGVDAITPTVLLYDRPASGLEAKFSMPFCAAAAIVDGRVGIDTFDDAKMRDDRIVRLMPRVRMQVEGTLDAAAPPLTEATVRVQLRDGRVLTQAAHGARGYPERPASDTELDTKFMTCATRALTNAEAATALGLVRDLEGLSDARSLARALASRS
ncbi:MAG TPA: MmgE/PrpD family protein, partial [Vicinamibacterales bacterium]|nr:MmgE/PrpD family protein [Vicinamibacterales bacterium]